MSAEPPSGSPSILVLAGRSMEPGLQPGFRLRIAPVADLPEPGAVVVLRSGGAPPAAFVVHRLVATAGCGGERLVFHRGDAGGRVGVAAAASVVGRVLAVLDPSDRAVPGLEDLDARQRRQFERAVRRCRAYAHVRAAGRWLGPRSLARPLARLVRRALLGS